MFPIPSSPPTPPRRPRTTPGLEPGERGRLVLLGVGLLLCFSLAAGLYSYIASGDAARPAPGPPQPGSGDPAPVDVAPLPLFPEDEGQEIQKILLEKAAGLPPVAQGVAAVEPGPFEFLVDQATLNARILNLLPEGFDPDPDLPRILADPGARFGQLIRVSGELLSLERLPYEGKGRQVLEIRRGLLRDAKGRLFTFSWPVGNSLEPDAVEPGKGWVRIRGLFYKTWPVADPAAPGKEVPTLHLVLQHGPEIDYPPVRVTDIDPAWMEQVHDEVAAEMLDPYDPPFYLLLNMVRGQGPAGFDAWLREKAKEAPGARIWPPEDFTGRYKDLLERPEVYRFRPVRYAGFLVKPSIEVARPNPGGLDRIAVGFLVDTDFAPAIWVFAPRSFVDQGFRNNDRVRVDGIFYKRVAYQPRDPKQPLSRAAVIIAGKIVQAPLGHGVGKDLLAVVLVLSALVSCGLVFVLLRTRKEDRVAEERRRERLARKKKAPGA